MRKCKVIRKSGMKTDLLTFKIPAGRSLKNECSDFLWVQSRRSCNWPAYTDEGIERRRGSSQSETRGLVVFHSRPLSMDIKSISDGDLFPHPQPVR